MDGQNDPERTPAVNPNQPEDIAKMAKRLSKHGRLDFCYEARMRLQHLPSACRAWARSHRRCHVDTSTQARKRIKTDRRDSQKLAILHRSAALTRVWVPNAAHEALRHLFRA